MSNNEVLEAMENADIMIHGSGHSVVGRTNKEANNADYLMSLAKINIKRGEFLDKLY